MNAPYFDRTLLIVDDEPEICRLLKDIADSLRIPTRIARSGNDAIRILERHAVTAVLSDIKMSDGDGQAVLRHIQKSGSGIPLAFLTADPSNETLQEALTLGTYEYLVKPFRVESIESLMFRIMAAGKSAQDKPRE